VRRLDASRDYEGAAGAFDAQLARAKRATAERNRLRGRIERLPRWMRDIELSFWGLASIGGGT
jgi:hypothetical protein